MATLVFRLRNVPEDEAESVRCLLDELRVDWYETTAGNWGIAMPGLWLTDATDVARVRAAIDQYQTQRRAEQQAHRETNEQPGIVERLRLHPYQTLGIVAFCLFLLYAMINPFIQLVVSTR